MEVLEGKVLEAFMEDFRYPKLAYHGGGSQQILCIGDSLTYGHGVVATRNTQSYPAVLSQLLKDAYQVVNAGACGRGILESGGKPYVKEAIFEELSLLNPKVIIMMLGTNDAKPTLWDEADFKVLYSHFIQILQQKWPVAKIFIAIPPMIFRQEQGEVMVQHVVPALEQLAKERQLQTVDLLSITQSHSEWVWDGVHYDATGYEAIANAVYQTLKLTKAISITD